MSFEDAKTEDRHDIVLRTVIETLREAADIEVGPGMVDINPETNLMGLVRDSGVFDSIGSYFFFTEIEDKLGISITDPEMLAFLAYPTPNSSMTHEAWERDVVPKLTVAAYADFIRKRYVPPSFEPVSVLGSPACPAAGYFVGMSEIVEQIKPDVERFGPSTPIASVLPTHQLTTFWMRLSRAADRSLPKLSFWLNRLANVLLIGSAACLLFGVFVDWAFLAAAWMLCVKGLLFAKWLYRRANPLPRGIVTFGDLSRYLAGQKEIPPSQSLSRRAGAWFGRTFLRRRTTTQTESPQGSGSGQSSLHRSA